VRAPEQYLVFEFGRNLNHGCGGNSVPAPIFVALHPWLPGNSNSLLFYSKWFRCDYDHCSRLLLRLV